MAARWLGVYAWQWKSHTDGLVTQRAFSALARNYTWYDCSIAFITIILAAVARCIGQRIMMWSSRTTVSLCAPLFIVRSLPPFPHLHLHLPRLYDTLRLWEGVRKLDVIQIYYGVHGGIQKWLLSTKHNIRITIFCEISGSCLKCFINSPLGFGSY